MFFTSTERRLFRIFFLLSCINSYLTSLQLSDSKWPSCVNTCFAEAKVGSDTHILCSVLSIRPVHPVETSPLGQLCAVLIWISYSHSSDLQSCLCTLARTQHNALHNVTPPRPVVRRCAFVIRRGGRRRALAFWLLFSHLLNEIHSFLVFTRLQKISEYE